MKKLIANQLFFTRVEKEDSPTGRSGFQTIASSRHRLTRDLIEDAEEYFVSAGKETSDGRFVFGPLANGFVVVAKISDSHRRDHCGRDGNYFVHAIVIEQQEWFASAYTPIELIANIPFVESSGDNEIGVTDDGRLNPFAIELGDVPEAVNVSTDLQPSEYAALASIAATVARGREQQRLLIAGETAAAMQTLHSVFQSMPKSVWPFLSFSVGAAEIEQQGQFWATAVSRDGAATQRADVVVNERTEIRVQLDFDAPTYARWLEHIIQASPSWPADDELESAWILSEFVDHGAPIHLPMDPQIADSIWQLVPQRSEQRVWQQFSERLGGALARRLVGHLVAHSSPADRFRRSVESSMPRLAQLLLEAYRHAEREPSAEEQKELERFAKASGDLRLMLLLAGWKNDRRRLSKAMKGLSEREYRQIVRDLSGVKTIDLTSLFVTKYAAAYAQALGANPSSSSQLVDIVLTLASARKHECIRWLAPLVPHCFPSEQQELWQICQKVNVPREFRAQLPRLSPGSAKPSRGLLARLFRGGRR